MYCWNMMSMNSLMKPNDESVMLQLIFVKPLKPDCVEVVGSTEQQPIDTELTIGRIDIHQKWKNKIQFIMEQIATKFDCEYQFDQIFTQNDYALK